MVGVVGVMRGPVPPLPKRAAVIASAMLRTCTGEKLVPPSARRGIIPLAIPLSEDQSGTFTALLRWPTSPQGMEMPVVQVQKHGVSLLAMSVDQYIQRILVEEDSNCHNTTTESLYTTSGDVGKKLYKKGDFAASKIENIDVYLLKKVALFPDVLERIALGHLERDDQVSALVTGEFYANRMHFPGFGRPFVFNAELFLKIGRKLEAKDAARAALKLPWWTLGCRYEKVAELAGWDDEQIEYIRERFTDEGRREDLEKGKAPAQIALDQAAFLMDLASVDASWLHIREQLADFYKEAG
ncbi:hypothetical protein KI387_031690, partial [Taxus chinensis]